MSLNRNIQTFRRGHSLHPAGRVIVTEFGTVDDKTGAVTNHPEPIVTEYTLEQWAELQQPAP